MNFQQIKAAARLGERLVDVGATLVADGETTEAVEPSQRALDHPAVAAKTLAAVEAAAV